MPGRSLSRAALVVVALALPTALASPLVSSVPAGVPSLRVVAAPEPDIEPTGQWRWPLAGVPEVVRGFDPPPMPWLAGHRGVDLAATAGVRARAAGAGVVVYAGPVAGRGVVSIDHAGGLRTTYEPVTASVRAGDTVGAGDPIGTVDPGHPGCPAEACLHWGLRRGETYLNPLALVWPLRLRLKPLAGSS